MSVLFRFVATFQLPFTQGMFGFPNNNNSNEYEKPFFIFDGIGA